jgi:hypothetical protein
MSTNPYAAPKAAVADEPVPQGEYIPGGKGVPASHGWSWIADGWTLFKAAPGLWIGMIVVFFVIYLAAMLVPFIGPVAQYLLMPVFFGGIAAGCRAIDDGSGLQFNHLFSGFQTKFGTLVAIGALYLAGFVAILVVVMVITGASVFALMAGGGVDADAVATGAAAMTLLLAVLIAAALSIPLLMAVWFAPALAMFHELGAVEAMKQSFTGPAQRRAVPRLRHRRLRARHRGGDSARPRLAGARPGIRRLGHTGYRDIYLR